MIKWSCFSLATLTLPLNSSHWFSKSFSSANEILRVKKLRKQLESVNCNFGVILINNYTILFKYQFKIRIYTVFRSLDVIGILDLTRMTSNNFSTYSQNIFPLKNIFPQSFNYFPQTFLKFLSTREVIFLTMIKKITIYPTNGQTYAHTYIGFQTSYSMFHSGLRTE